MGDALVPAEIVDGELVETEAPVLSPAAADLLARAAAVNTVRTYGTQWRLFTGWCDARGAPVLPAAETTVANYLADLAGAGRSPKTLEAAVAAIGWHHAQAGHPAPSGRSVAALLHTHRRDTADAGRGPRKARVLAPAQLRAVLRACDASTPRGLRDRAFLALSLRTGRRFAEVARLRLDDVLFDTDGMLYLVRRTKTDQTGQTAQWQRLVLHHDPDLCVVRAVAAWRDLLLDRRAGDGPLIRRVDRYGRVAGEPGITGAGSATGELSNEAANAIWRAALRRADIDPAGVSTHTARRSAMTNGHRAGVGLTDLTDRLGYVRGSRVALGYIEAATAATTDPLAGLL
jgi:integrase